MVCGSCAAARARRNSTTVTKYVWQSEDGMDEMVYDEAVQAKAKVLRKGGSYRPKEVPR